jgi:sigma-B regulation protein RsbU (phosphoserine phosphatase)
VSTLPLPGPALREGLLLRRQRLHAATRAEGRPDDEILALLGEVDAALSRLDSGTFGTCEKCHDSVEEDRLAADPLVRYCLECLSTDQRRALEDDLERAAAVQAALLPPREIDLPGWEIRYHYEPAGMVSGDFCDVVPGDGRGGDAWFLLGDVSGKGVSASLLMSNLQAIFRGLIGSGTAPGEMMSAAGRLFCENTLSSHYATALCGRAMPGGSIEIVNAGHCPPLLLREGRASEVEGGGLPLGLFCSVGYQETRLALEPGDALVLFTDGLTEGRGPDGEEYGVKRLSEQVTRQGRSGSGELTRRCVEDLAAFRAGGASHDDLTLMTVKRTG